MISRSLHLVLQSSKRRLRSAYHLLPVRFRLGRTFRRTYDFLQQSQWWSREEIESYQLGQLQAMVQYAGENSPYYRRAFRERGMAPDGIRDLKDLVRLPLMTKQILQSNLDEVVVQNVPRRRRHYLTTGGSSGLPFGFYDDARTSFPRESAFIYHLWSRVGFQVGDRTVVIRGGVVDTADAGRYDHYDRDRRELALSSYHMTDDTLREYVAIIRRYRPAFIQAYPSAITILARLISENAIRPFESVQAILCGSENVYDWQRQAVEEAFHCRLYSWYGHSERSVLAGESETSRAYFLCPEYGYAELIDPDGNPITQPGVPGEIVATGFNNRVTPFIRYRTGDVASWSAEPSTDGRHHRALERIEGRLQELIVTETGRRISMTAINMHSDVFDNVRQFQFLQKRRGQVVFNVVRKNSFTDSDTRYIRSELERKLGPDMQLSIHFVDEIAPTPRGKHRFLIQKLPVEFGD